jgi:hypothetical protein
MVVPSDFIGVDVVRIPFPRGGERRARRYYVEALGLEECGRPCGAKGRGGIWLRVGGSWLHLAPEEPFAPRKDAFPALRAGSACAVADRLERQGFEVKRSKAADGRCHVLIEDPFGNVLEVTDDTGPVDREFRL